MCYNNIILLVLCKNIRQYLTWKLDQLLIRILNRNMTIKIFQTQKFLHDKHMYIIVSALEVNHHITTRSKQRKISNAKHNSSLDLVLLKYKSRYRSQYKSLYRYHAYYLRSVGLIDLRKNRIYKIWFKDWTHHFIIARKRWLYIRLISFLSKLYIFDLSQIFITYQNLFKAPFHS